MGVMISVFYPLWYRSHRMQIKEIVNTDDIVTAKNLLDTIIIEHDTISDPEENSSLHHAQDHLNALDSTGQTNQKDATVRALEE